MEDEHPGKDRDGGGQIGENRLPRDRQPRDGVAGEEKAYHGADQRQKQNRQQIAAVCKGPQVFREVSLAADQGQDGKDRRAHAHHGIGAHKGGGLGGELPGQERVGRRAAHRHQQGRDADPVQGSGAAVHKPNADDSAHGQQAERDLTAGGPLLQNRPGRERGDHRDHRDHDAGKACGGMQNAILLAQKVDHRLGQPQRQQGQQHPAGLPQTAKLPGESVHHQKREQKAVAQQHEHVGGVQPRAGGQKAQPPKRVAEDGGQRGPERGTVVVFHTVLFDQI